MYISYTLLILGTWFFPQHLITEILKNKEKLTEFFGHPYFCDLDSIHFAVFGLTPYQSILFVDVFQNKLTVFQSGSSSLYSYQLCSSICSASILTPSISTSILTLGIVVYFMLDILINV